MPNSALSEVEVVPAAIYTARFHRGAPSPLPTLHLLQSPRLCWEGNDLVASEHL